MTVYVTRITYNRAPASNLYMQIEVENNKHKNQICCKYETFWFDSESWNRPAAFIFFCCQTSRRFWICFTSCAAHLLRSIWCKFWLRKFGFCYLIWWDQMHWSHKVTNSLWRWKWLTLAFAHYSAPSFSISPSFLLVKCTRWMYLNYNSHISDSRLIIHSTSLR